MNEKDWVEIDRANGRLECACVEVRAAYVKQIKRLEDQLNEANTVINSARILYNLCIKQDYGVAHTGVFKGDYEFLKRYLERYGEVTDQLITEILNERSVK